MIANLRQAFFLIYIFQLRLLHGETIDFLLVGFELFEKMVVEFLHSHVFLAHLRLLKTTQNPLLPHHHDKQKLSEKC